MKNPALPAAATPVLQAPDADVAEPVDARDLKSLGGNPVRVRVPPSAPTETRGCTFPAGAALLPGLPCPHCVRKMPASLAQSFEYATASGQCANSSLQPPWLPGRFEERLLSHSKNLQQLIPSFLDERFVIAIFRPHH